MRRASLSAVVSGRRKERERDSINEREREREKGERERRTNDKVGAREAALRY